MATNDFTQLDAEDIATDACVIVDLVERNENDKNEVSLRNPTWQYLNENFKKVELQKHCRDLGLK